MHGPWRRVSNASRKTSPLAARCASKIGVGLRGHGQVALAAEIERLQGDPDRLAVLVAEAEPSRRSGYVVIGSA